MKFAKLSEHAKEAAREAFRTDHNGYPYDDWWDSVYDDAVTCGALLGITIYNRVTRTAGGKPYSSPDINFSGFWSQGDGACFVGAYEPPGEPMAILEHAPKDKELARIAGALVALQTAAKLATQDRLVARITRGRYGGGYSHSGTMGIQVTVLEDEASCRAQILGDVEPTPEEAEALTQLMRDFADWIYAQLRQEHDYLMSDECVDSQLADGSYNRTGASL